MNLTTATPVQIDTELYRLDGEAAKADRSLSIALVQIHRAVGDDTGYRKPNYDLTHNEAIAKAEATAGTEGDFLRAAEKALESLKKATAEVSAVADQTRPLNAEFVNRGGWTRAFLALVNGNGGHVHSSQDCSTCNNGKSRTQFARQPQYSGADEATIIADAGYRACTVCYKDAPVDATAKTHPTKIYSEDEITAQAAREKRAADKAAREAKKLEKAITADGSELTVPDGYSNSSTRSFKTEQAARNWLVDHIGGHRAWGYKYSPEAVAIITEALAAKHGVTVEAETVEIEKKVTAWTKRNTRG